jgi:DNA invertase Pin-like site-specific DNA recombinase
MRAVIYARYSSDLQREASIDDQVEVCRRYADAQGWTIVQTYKDAAISGASRFRPGFQELMRDAGDRQFDVVICEAIDRLGRRLADTADLQDQLAFQGIRLHTPSLGEITHIHVAVMGMMAQMALKDLGEKTKRGQLGRVLKGRVPAGIAYGYRTAAGGDERGARTIDADEAAVVRRIFKAFVSGKSPEAIVRDLNREGVAGPGGRPWSNTTLRGQLDRGTGVLNNALYRGVIEWNRCAYTKNPKTGKRVARPNPPDRWERVEVPELRVVDDELWFSAKARQQSLRQTMGKALPRSHGSAAGNRLNEAHRPRFLLSGLLRCGCCGGPYAIVGRDRFACSTRKQKGTCDNRLTITRQKIEARVLEGLKNRLLAPDLVAVFVEAFREETKRQRDARRAEEAGRQRRAAELDRKIAGILRAIEDGLYEPAMKARLAELRQERDKLRTDRPGYDPAALDVLLHPQLAEGYRRRIERLEGLLDGPDQGEAREIVRSMIERVVLTPRLDGRGLDATLFGALGALLSVSAEVSGDKKPPAARPAGGQLSVVAGARYHLNRTTILLPGISTAVRSTEAAR